MDVLTSHYMFKNSRRKKENSFVVGRMHDD